MKKYPFTLVAAFVVLLSANAVMADDFKEAATKLCDKMTMCIIEQINSEEDLPPQMKEMATAVAKNACSSLYEMESFIIDEQHQDAAVTCLESAAKKNCESLQEGLETPECEKFEKLIEQTTR